MSHPDRLSTPTPTPFNPRENDHLRVTQKVLEEFKGDIADPFAESVATAGGPREFTRLARNTALMIPHASRAIMPILPAVAAAAALAGPVSLGLGVAIIGLGVIIHLTSREGSASDESSHGYSPLTPRTSWLGREEERRELAYLDKTMLRFRERLSYQPGDWQQEILDDSGFGDGIVTDQLPGDLRDLRSASGRVTAHTWLLGDTLETGVVPALSGVTDSLRPANIAFGEMDMGYHSLTWTSSDVREVLTVNTAAMSGGLTQWAAAVSEENEQLRRELEAYLLQPAPRRDSPPGRGPSGGGLSWDEGLDLYQRKTGETAENIAWIRTHPDDKAQSGANVEWTFRDIARDAVRRSGEVPLFAMGGVVPGMIGTPVPAIVHGGERIVGPGNRGGVPINLEVHVHGTVISEGDLAKNVRDGLMRRFA